MSISKKKVLVTGASGFIASHLTRRLVKEGAHVMAMVKYNSIVDNVRICDCWNDIQVIEADLRNQDSLKQVQSLKPDIIYHLAAYNHVGDSFLHVSESLDSNGKGTANLLEAYDDFERFIYISTSEVYGYQESVPFQEDAIPTPISPYSVGKYTGELYCRMKMTQMKRPIVIVRPFNAFGPYQSPRAVITEMVLKCLKNQTIESTEGIQTREFNFVENLVDGFILAGTVDKAPGNIMNLGSGVEIPIKDLIVKIHELTGSSSELKIGALDYRPTEIWRMFASNERAKNILGWEPKVGFEEGLKKTVEWFKQFLEVYETSSSPLVGLTRSHSS